MIVNLSRDQIDGRDQVEVNVQEVLSISTDAVPWGQLGRMFGFFEDITLQSLVFLQIGKPLRQKIGRGME